MDAIPELITKNDWNLLCWDDRYSRGIWAIVTPHPNHMYKIREIIDGEGMLSTELGFYFQNEGSWLPVANGNNLMDVLTKLDDKIKPMIGNTIWKRSVYDTFQHFLEENYSNFGLEIALKNKVKILLKPEEL
ncbi:hypothetical protein P9W99_14330 [Bacillus cereus]|uniref:Uncharacterized protein n=2 Tax=Bacillus cereus group TaxID=86661 RepID=Q2ESR9_BACTU|nr:MULTISPECIES: hypothetical protein [Bacillus cereus group]ABD24309.1 hypothetical protein pBMB67_006 [Bacillus thuringiensis]AHZ55266.1 hypothetical protein YBT1520_33361 [Bacillus thuringiensis serovar kurstaki str. YBT-1520]AIE36923.1 hypothetical protein BTK_34416 [Bacillus thuringiensis serovar kurstaki str. HD-1]AJK38428.1 hypothetical protein BG08_6748 [Bacillus thuringiensis serovar kurstaki]AKJ63264.1 hypothetical protein XI92_34630 [Bacillus thuringiensis]